MAGSAIVTNLDLQTSMKMVGSVAKDMGYSVSRVEDDELRLKQGNLAASIFLGAFIAYCDFKVIFQPKIHICGDIEMNRYNPWWTGLIGVGRVKNMFKKLVDAVEDEIEHAGGQILNSENF